MIFHDFPCQWPFWERIPPFQTGPESKFPDRGIDRSLQRISRKVEPIPRMFRWAGSLRPCHRQLHPWLRRMSKHSFLRKILEKCWKHVLFEDCGNIERPAAKLTLTFWNEEPCFSTCSKGCRYLKHAFSLRMPWSSCIWAVSWAISVVRGQAFRPGSPQPGATICKNLPFFLDAMRAAI